MASDQPPGNLQTASPSNMATGKGAMAHKTRSRPWHNGRHRIGSRRLAAGLAEEAGLVLPGEGLGMQREEGRLGKREDQEGTWTGNGLPPAGRGRAGPNPAVDTRRRRGRHGRRACCRPSEEVKDADGDGLCYDWWTVPALHRFRRAFMNARGVWTPETTRSKSMEAAEGTTRRLVSAGGGTRRLISHCRAYQSRGPTDALCFLRGNPVFPRLIYL